LRQVPFLKKDKFGPGDSQVVKDCKDGQFLIAESWRSLRREKIKKAKPKIGLAFFTYGSLNAVVLVRGHSLFRFEARRGRCTHIRETNKIFIV
jgi:hypothetical protein